MFALHTGKMATEVVYISLIIVIISQCILIPKIASYVLNVQLLSFIPQSSWEK